MSEFLHNDSLDKVLDELLTIIEKKGVNSEEVLELRMQHPDFQEDISKYVDTWKGLNQVEIPSPSANMDIAFYKMLSQETAKMSGEGARDSSIAKVKNWMNGALRDMKTWAVLGAVIGAFLIGWYVSPSSNAVEAEKGLYPESESTMQFASLEGASAFDKMAEIQKTKEANDPNDVVLDMLRRRLIFDESVSVRLSALEVLMKFADEPKVRGYLIESIPHQTEPIVIVELAELMNQLDEKDSAKEWKQLLESEWMETDVRLQIEDKLSTIL